VSIDIKQVAVVIVVMSGILAGGYAIVNKNDSKSEMTPNSQNKPELADESSPASSQAGKLAPGATLPSDHPPLIPDSGQTTGQVAANTNELAEAKAKFTHFRVGNKNIKSIYADDDGIIWIGTSGGVIRYETEKDDYRLFNVRNGLLANGVFYVGKINDKIAIGTYGGGLALYDEQLDRFDIFNVPEGLADAFVYDTLQMENGDIWIATWSGANRIIGGDLTNPKAWETYTVENTNSGLPNDWVYGLAKGKNGELWLATEGGLSRHKDGKWQSWDHEAGLGADYDLVKDDNEFTTDPAEVSSHHARQKVEMNLQNVNTAYNPNYIIALDVTPDGTVWMGTWGGGLARFDGENWRNYTVKDGMPSNHVFMLHVDKQGKLWIGTSKGVAYFKEDGKGFGLMNAKDGLFNDTVFSMESLDDGTFWIGSFGGISRIKP